MPWKASKSESEERQEFLNKLLLEGMPMSGLCRAYGISRKTGYKWLHRYRSGESLEDRSRRPKASPGATSEEVVSAVLELRGRHRFLGGGKISTMLRKRGLPGVPSGTTVTSILRSHGLLDREAGERARHYVRFQKCHANEMWQFDFKGHFALGDGTRCHTLNGVDDYSRFCLCCEPLLSEDMASVRPVFVRMFGEYGLPFSTLQDNGNPWGKKGAITMFDTWLMELGVLPLHGRPLHPQTQGKEERFNGSFTRELLKYRIPEDMAHAKELFDAYRAFYNDERPHCALEGKCPADLYRPSPRPYPREIFEWEYDEGTETRLVDVNGLIAFRACKVYVGGGLRGKRVALLPVRDGAFYNVIFRQFLVGRINMATRKNEFCRAYLLEGDPRPEIPLIK